MIGPNFLGIERLPRLVSPIAFFPSYPWKSVLSVVKNPSARMTESVRGFRGGMLSRSGGGGSG